MLAGAIHDHVQRIPGIGNYSIVDYAALLIHNQRQFTIAWLEHPDIPTNNLFEEDHSVLTVPVDLTHMGHVEQGCLTCIEGRVKVRVRERVVVRVRVKVRVRGSYLLHESNYALS